LVTVSPTEGQMVVRDDPVIEKWRQFDWESLQGYLDGEIRAQESRQSAAEEGKHRLLTESTKYRETTDKEQRKAALPLIKAFQREVDECRDRERAVGAALVQIFGKLADLPDPRSALSAASTTAAARAATAEEEAAALKREIASITEEFAGLKNQDVTVRQLREQIKELEKDKMSAIERLLAETEKAIQDSSIEKDEEKREIRDQHAASVSTMEKQIVDLEARLRAQQRQLDGALADAGHKETVEGDEKEEREREMDIIQRKLKGAEREISALTAELREAKAADRSSSPPASPIGDIAALGGLMKEKDEQISRLLEDNRRLLAKASADARAAEQKVAKMQNELSKQRELIIHMQAELAGKGDYEAVKQELRALREIELGPEAAAALDDNTPQTTVGEALKKLDKYMSDKNKKLQSENVQLRKAKEELNGSLATVTAQLESLSQSDREKTGVIERLERDVERLTRGRKSAPVPDDPELTTDELLAASLGTVADYSSEGHGSQRDTVVGGSQSMMEIVKAQRDRMKERLNEIEEAMAREKTDAARVRSEMEKVREDNTQLYGKVRFLQSHRSGSMAVTIDEDGAYKQEWEQTMSPFARFTNQESLRHVQKLPIHDKATLSIARAVFSNASARFTFFCYLIVLHLLVFMVLYHSAWSSASSRDDCVEQFAKHMKEHHH
ncbi:hypothetical protein PENTCL1PPCAC_10148, partial [Pristionchus entomophagus]